MQVNCHQIVNEWLHSNTYILSIDESEDIWLVDCGDFAKVANWLQKYNKRLKGILITHSHHDHIYGVVQALELYPGINVYLSHERGREYMADTKLNMSRYTNTEVSIISDRFVDISEGDIIELWDGVFAKAKETPGHTPDCLSFEIGEYLFTGDAFIPYVKLTARSKGGNKEMLVKSIEKIINYIETHKCIICAGHGDTVTSEKLIQEKECTIRIH